MYLGQPGGILLGLMPSLDQCTQPEGFTGLPWVRSAWEGICVNLGQSCDLGEVGKGHLESETPTKNSSRLRSPFSMSGSTEPLTPVSSHSPQPGEVGIEVNVILNRGERPHREVKKLHEVTQLGGDRVSSQVEVRVPCVCAQNPVHWASDLKGSLWFLHTPQPPPPSA